MPNAKDSSTSAQSMAETSPLHERLTAATGDRTYRAISDLTGVHAETVRRYMQGQSPSIEFIAKLCDSLGISGEWILTGKGPMRSADTRSHALKEANPAELLAAMASTVDRITERIGRLEVYVQTLETRLRAAAGTPPTKEDTDEPEASTGSARAKRVGAAVKKREHPDDR